MSNKEIIGKIKRLIKFLELHRENDNKIRSYQNAVQRLERYQEPLVEKNETELQNIEGIGQSIARLVYEIATTSEATKLQTLEENTPAGLIELMQFRGLGTKKLATLWNDFGIEDKNSLKLLLDSGELLSAKGFGQKTVENLTRIVDYAFACEGKIYYCDAEKIATFIIQEIKSVFSGAQISFTGKLRRKWEVIEAIEILTDIPITKLIPVLNNLPIVEYDVKKSGPFSWKGRTTGEIKATVVIYPTTKEKFTTDLLLKTGSQHHLSKQTANGKFIDHIRQQQWQTEEACYADFGMEYCQPEIREGDWELDLALEHKLPTLIDIKDLKGIIHNHTRYSDGQNSLTEMAEACRDLGYAYLGITDHSKAANFYANGMFEESVARQQEEIDQLNTSMAPFKIFKGIEADILSDGALDYDNKTLATFDFVVASVHSGLTMDRKKATERLITAIANPYTTILGHMSGRLLLQRQGYPVDHEAIINACAEFGVIIEINAHPKRLDIDWRWVRKALDNGVILSINPDAHEIKGFNDMQYGVYVGRKGGLTKDQTFNAWPYKKVETYLTERRKRLL